MSEAAPPPYIVRDYCAHCGERLVVLETGGRVACHPDSAMYWSEAEPLRDDARGLRQFIGREPRVQTEWYDWRSSSPDYGRRIDHAPLFLYRRIA